jgi:hypothetical protein
MKFLKLLIITWSLGVQAGLPPTTLNGVTTFNFISDELLKNADLEVASLTGSWTCTTGTASSTNTVGEVGKGLRALKITSGSPTAIRCYQTVATLTGSPVQHYVRGFYKFLLADLPDFQICSLINGNLLANEQTCFPTAKLIGDNTYRPFEIPVTVTPGQSVGVVFKTTATSTAKSAYIDTMSLKQGLGLINIQTDNVYSAKISAAGVVSDENKAGWISSTSIAATSTYTLNIKAGTFTVPPTCVTTLDAFNAGSSFLGTPATASVVKVSTYSTAFAASAIPFTIVCQKSGVDYLASSANVYSSTNGNYSRRAYTPTFTGFGTVTGVDCYESRHGEFNEIDCKFISGTPTAVPGTVTLPAGLTSANTATINAGSISTSIANTNILHVLSLASTNTAITFGVQSGGAAGLTPLVANGWVTSGNTVSFTARIPISGWSNSNVIVGSFEKIEKCASVDECTDVYSAAISGAGVVTSESTEWITGNCVTSATSTQTCTVPSGVFTVLPNCGASTQQDGRYNADFIAASSTVTSLVFRTADSNTQVAGARPMAVFCQKTGVDSKPKTAKIASSIGVPTVPGITTQAIDTFSFTYGDTSTTGCSVSPCAYVDQIGDALFSPLVSPYGVTRVGAGTYTIHTNKTYSKLKCTAGAEQYAVYGFGNFNLSCANCNSLSFVSFDTFGGSPTDSIGTFMCQGTY